MMTMITGEEAGRDWGSGNFTSSNKLGSSINKEKGQN